MNFARFEQILEQTMGLSAPSIGTSAIERAVSSRLRACDLGNADDYWEHLQRAPGELQELVEAVVVPETWFFRDPQAFSAMTRIAMEEWLPAHPSGVLRLLSLPCSTGEEPYTMAMALIDAGLPAARLQIDAIDISAHALTKARCALYGRNSFRGKDLAFRERHFDQGERGYALNERVRAPIRFVQGNLLDANFLGGGDSYDIVFCRNLLIYFDAETQNRAITVLKRLLSPQGTLFIGHSEAGLMHGQGLVSAKIPMAFAFRKAVASTKTPKQAPVAASPDRKAVRPAPKLAAESPKRAPPFKRALPATPPPPDLEDLRRIADRGQLAEAVKGCEAYIRQRGPSPEAFLLLGVICDASGDLSAAAGHYRKVLYLEPDNPEALDHLALLLKKQGDVSGAKMLNDRIRRLDARRAG
jgi:chemotaxis protein methyltransferase WspC